jgi:cation transport ATPase
MTEDEIKVEFRKRERKVLVSTFIAAIVLGAYFVSSFIIDIYINPSIPFIVFFAVIFVSLFKFYRCPKCNSLPPPLGGEGIQLAPRDCGRCGVKLR